MSIHTLFLKQNHRVFNVLQRMAAFVVVISIALAWSPGTAAASSESLHFSFKGQSAEAFFDKVDPSGCIDTSVYVTAQDGTIKQTGHPDVSSLASTFISVYDICNDVLLLAADGSATLSADAFVIDKKLNFATLSTSIEVFDFVSATSFPVNYSVSWTGFGDPFRQKDHFQIKAPGFKVNSRFDGTFRNANASGTVSDGVTNFTPDPSVFAELGSVKTGEVDIIHQ